MALPLKVQNSLRQGLDRAAQVASPYPDGLAWVWIRPIMQSGQGFQEVCAGWTRARQSTQNYNPAISRYEVRYLALSPYDPDIDLEEYDADSLECTRTVRDNQANIADEEALEQWLNQYLPDLAQLRDPSSVGYYF